MFEKLRIRLFGDQPTPNITDKVLDRLIRREFPKNVQEVKKKLDLIESDSKKGKNRFSAAVLRLSGGDLSKIDTYVEMCNYDFRDVIMQAEYRRISQTAFDDTNINEEKEKYLGDWTDYLTWLSK